LSNFCIVYSIDLSRGKHFKDLANLILLGSFMFFPCGVFMLWCEVARKSQSSNLSRLQVIKD
jgi:hypothetical protein